MKKEIACLVWVLFLSVFMLSFLPSASRSATYNIFPPSASPASFNQPDYNPYTLGVQFQSAVAGQITGIRFYKSSNDTGTHIGTLWSNTGTQLATATFTGETASGWQEVDFSSAVSISANTTYVASYTTTVGQYSGSSNFFTNGDYPNGYLRGLQDGTYGPSGCYVGGSTPAFPTNSSSGFNYWVDVVFTPNSGVPLPPTSVYHSSEEPFTYDSGDTAAVELGIQFESTVAGYVDGVRFFKASANTGTHVGSLWTTSGTLLAQATFTNEGASGWQQVNFSSPVLISANTTYVVSYHTNVGHYAFAPKFYTQAGGGNADSQLLVHSSFNGVYTYSSAPAYPVSSYNSPNYWVDVVFSPTSSTGGANMASYYSTWSNGPNPTGSTSYFPIGIWQEYADRLVNGVPAGSQYTALGINIDVDGLVGAGDGSWHGMTGWQQAGGAGTFGLDSPFTFPTATSGAAWFLADEPDMNQDNFAVGNELTAPPLLSEANAVRAADTTRPTYANYGKPMGIYNWIGALLGYSSPAAPSYGAMMAEYGQTADIVSCDVYGYTDPTENPGAYVYGRAIDNIKLFCGFKPTLGFVETGHPIANYGTTITATITAAQIQAAVWDMIVHGANGIIYFDLDFYGPNANPTFNSYGLLTSESGSDATVQSIDQELTALAPVLNCPNMYGLAPTVTSTNGVPMTTMIKSYGGHTWLFVIADGSPSLIGSGSTTATITVPGIGTESAPVYNESRNISVTSGTLTDSFTAYQVHIYEL